MECPVSNILPRICSGDSFPTLESFHTTAITLRFHSLNRQPKQPDFESWLLLNSFVCICSMCCLPDSRKHVITDCSARQTGRLFENCDCWSWVRAFLCRQSLWRSFLWNSQSVQSVNRKWFSVTCKLVRRRIFCWADNHAKPSKHFFYHLDIFFAEYAIATLLPGDGNVLPVLSQMYPKWL